MMDRQDDLDTIKVVNRDNDRVELQSAIVAPGARVELQVDVSEPTAEATLYMSLDIVGADVVVEQMAVGKFIVAPGPMPVSTWRYGRIMRDAVSPSEPLRILLVNRDSCEVKVGASLVTSERPGAYSIVKKG
jgi:hypothetical protein